MCDCNDVKIVETVGEFKKNVKALVKGAIKAKVFGGEDNKYNFSYMVGNYDKKAKQGYVMVGISAGDLEMKYEPVVSTRVFNKVTAEFFAPIAEQFGKLKSVNEITFDECTCECTCED